MRRPDKAAFAQPPSFHLLLVFRWTLAYSNRKHREALTVAISDELSDEEQAIMVFLKRYFEAARMPDALWILSERESIGWTSGP